MSPEDLITCVARLTGTEVKGQDEIDIEGLAAIVHDDSRAVDCSQLNELLLMVHKDRVEAPFFDHFFGPDCTIGTIPQGVGRFQRAALLLYGNFVFGYRKLSRMKDAAEFKREVAAAFPDAKAEAAYFQSRLIATAEKIVYDKRARTLKESHPLALQVNLDTGVANGVLVVRTIPDCAALLRRVLLGEMEFSLEEKAGMWRLREKISGCIYRVVTNDRKLNNCFWNFYLR